MHRTNAALLASALSLALLGGPAVAAAEEAAAATPDAAVSYDGLVRTTVNGVELAFVRPGASLAGYTAVQLEPVQVSFHSDFSPTRPGSRSRMGERDLAQIRTQLAAVVQNAFTRALGGKGGYQVVEAPGPHVLQVRVEILDLYVTAPGTQTAGRTRTFTSSAGRMTLAATLYDSDTGEVLARVIDRQQARRSPTMQLTNSVTNSAEARTIADRWANILRRALDDARSIGGG